MYWRRRTTHFFYYDLASQPRRRVRATRGELQEKSDVLFSALSVDQRDAVILAMFETAYDDCGRKQLNESERKHLSVLSKQVNK